MIRRLRIAIGRLLMRGSAPAALPQPSIAELEERLQRARLQHALAIEAAGQNFPPFKVLSEHVSALWAVADELGYSGPRTTINVVAWACEQLKARPRGDA